MILFSVQVDISSKHMLPASITVRITTRTDRAITASMLCMYLILLHLHTAYIIIRRNVQVVYTFSIYLFILLSPLFNPLLSSC